MLIDIISFYKNIGSLMGDTALLLTLYPNISVVKPDHSAVGELIFLLDRSDSMGSSMGYSDGPPSCIQSAKVSYAWIERLNGDL